MRNVPFYRQVADTLEARIAAGEYSVGSCLPSLVELEKEFQVSNITIRKALNLLKEGGSIETRLGVGMIVARSGEEKFVDIHHSGKFEEWLEWASGKSQNVRQTVLSIHEESGPPRVRQLLQADEGEKLWCMKRLRSRLREPISYHISYGKLEFSSLAKKRDFQESGSFIEFLQERYPSKIVRIDQTVEAQVANMDLAKLLKTSFGAPIFFMEHIYMGEKEQVVAISHLYLRADRYRYSTSIDL